jgi:hypothetical protein
MTVFAEWRCQVIPRCVPRAREAVERLHALEAQDVSASLQTAGDSTWLVLHLQLDDVADRDALAAKALSGVWPAWRGCIR